MAVIIKTIKNREYAYLCTRDGRKVRHSYIGLASDPIAALLLSEQERGAKMPQALYPFFWDADPRKFSLREHSRYIIERILELGTFEAVQWMELAYPRFRILEVLFLGRGISEKSRQFWSIWFGVLPQENGDA